MGNEQASGPKGMPAFFENYRGGGNVKRGRMFFSPTFINHAYYENRSNSLADHHQGGSNQACQSEGVQSLPLRQDREGQKSLPEVLGH